VALGFVLQVYQEFDRECRQRRRSGRAGKCSLQREVGLLRLLALPQLPLEALFDGLIPGSLDRSHAAGGTGQSLAYWPSLQTAMPWFHAVEQDSRRSPRLSRAWLRVGGRFLAPLEAVFHTRDTADTADSGSHPREAAGPRFRRGFR
jgi:hypothetical protein